MHYFYIVFVYPNFFVENLYKIQSQFLGRIFTTPEPRQR